MKPALNPNKLERSTLKSPTLPSSPASMYNTYDNTEPEYEYYYEYIYEEDLEDFQDNLAPTTTLVTTIPTQETLFDLPQAPPKTQTKEPPMTASNGNEQPYRDYEIKASTAPTLQQNVNWMKKMMEKGQ